MCLKIGSILCALRELQLLAHNQALYNISKIILEVFLHRENRFMEESCLVFLKQSSHTPDTYS